MSKTSLVIIALLIFIGACVWDHNDKENKTTNFNQETATMVSQCQADKETKWTCNNITEVRKAEWSAEQASDGIDSVYWLVFIMWMWI